MSTSLCISLSAFVACLLFFFNDTAPTEIYTLSLHDALPILRLLQILIIGERQALHDRQERHHVAEHAAGLCAHQLRSEEHTSEPSHTVISYAVFCLKKKKNTNT